MSLVAICAGSWLICGGINAYLVSSAFWNINKSWINKMKKLYPDEFMELHGKQINQYLASISLANLVFVLGPIGTMLFAFISIMMMRTGHHVDSYAISKDTREKYRSEKKTA